MEERLYFAYGSNMNLEQMEFRCPKAIVVENVQVEDYRLTFCGKNSDNGVATILREEGSHVDGVLWKITSECEKSLDRYEGYPHLYGKETISVKNADGQKRSVMVYTMNTPFKEYPARPSNYYLKGILEGCRENKLSCKTVMDAVKQTQVEIKERRQTNRADYHSQER